MHFRHTALYLGPPELEMALPQLEHRIKARVTMAPGGASWMGSRV